MGSDPRQLVESASRGDAAAVESLLERYLPGLERYARRHAGDLVVAKESGADLVQSVCRELLDRLGSERFEYRGEAEFKQWLYQAALLKIRNRRRYYLADRRDAGREVAFDPEQRRSREDAFFRTLSSPSRQAMLHEELERVRAVFGELPESYRRVITLAHVEERPHREIAEILGITEAHSRVLLSRALARLATLRTRLGD